MSANEVYLDVSAKDDLLTIVSTHPESQNRRRVSIGVDAGRVVIAWDYADSPSPASKSAGSFADATPFFALKGSADGADAILEALNYPRDERAAASRFLVERLPVVAPASLMAVIDVRAIEALQAVVSPTVLSMDFYSGDGERQDRRRQAAKSLPLLAGYVANTLSLKMTVDRSKPLMDAVIGTLNGRTSGVIGKATIRRLAGVTDRPFLTGVETIIEFASRIPADWIPAAGQDWKAFCLIADGVVNRLNLSSEETTSFLKGCSGRWNDFATRLVAPLNEGRVDPDIEETLPGAFRSISAMIECFTNVVVIPLSVHGAFVSDVTVNAEAKRHAFEVAKRMIFGEKSAPSLVALSRKWQSQQAAILDATRLSEDERKRVMLQEVPLDGWPALCDPVTAPNGLTLVPLNSPDQLTYEGASGPDPKGADGLHHCVGGYSSKCRSGDSHVLSVREIDDNGVYRRVSTVEFTRLNPASDVLSQSQHYGHRDTTPSGKAQDAVAWFKEAVALGQVPLKRSLIEAFERTVLEAMDGVERSCGFDWRDADTIAQAVAPWAPYVDAAYRNKGFEDLLAMDDLVPIRESIPPELIGSAMTARR